MILYKIKNYREIIFNKFNENDDKIINHVKNKPENKLIIIYHLNKIKKPFINLRYWSTKC